MADRELINRHFGRRLAFARKRATLSQELLAKKLGSSRATIANIESGRQGVPLHTVYAIATTLGIQLADLLPDPAELGGDIDSLVSDGRIELTQELRRKSDEFTQKK